MGARDSTKPIDTVVICASGKGTRLMPLTKHIPKYLVNPDNFNILTHIVNYWASYTEHIAVIIEEKYTAITEYYLKQLGVSYTIIHVNIDQQGNAYTLYTGLKDIYDHQRVLITWCDIFPAKPIPESAFTGAVIFTHGNECRYNIKDGLIAEQAGGNIIGIYYFDDFVKMNYMNESEDIINVLQRYHPVVGSYEIEELVDVGDMTKLVNYEHKNTSLYDTRYYNKITPVGINLLKKESAHPIGDDIIRGEINFYNSIQQYKLACFPKVYEFGDTYFIMEKIDGAVLKTLNIDMYLENYIETLKGLHGTSTLEVSRETLVRDLSLEFNIKIKEHVAHTKVLADQFRFIRRVNGTPILLSDITYAIDDLYERIEKELLVPGKNVYDYALIHADAHFSNTMVDSGKIVFIDPYGRFGDSMVHGSAYFDYCLILFSLTGFDKFSAWKQYHFDIEGDNLLLNIDIQDLDKYRPILEKHGINWNICICMCILHWLKFTYYTSNHILKSVAAYYHGMYLYHRYILESK